jgi:hypothetical protein
MTLQSCLLDVSDEICKIHVCRRIEFIIGAIINVHMLSSGSNRLFGKWQGRPGRNQFPLLGPPAGEMYAVVRPEDYLEDDARSDNLCARTHAHAHTHVNG